MLDAVRKRQMPVIGGGAGIWSFTEITDAATATAVAAITRGVPGIYNIVDDDPAPVAEWLPYLAECLDAKRPDAALPVWLGRLLAGEVIVAQMTQVRGSSNAKARRELGWAPGYPSWRDGFPVWVDGLKTAQALMTVPPEGHGSGPQPTLDFRPLMFSIAYRMTGSISDAEDIVQEAFLRLTRVLRDGTVIDSPEGLPGHRHHPAGDQPPAVSARVRRESYVGAWLPEPLVAEPARTGSSGARGDV